VSYLSFETQSDFKEWTKGRRQSQSNGFSKFLGPLYDGEETFRHFKNVPGDADEISIQFSFYEIDNWNKNRGDRLEVRINGFSINVGTFDTNEDEGVRTGYIAEGDLNWSMSSLESPEERGFGSALDQRHRFVATFPRSYNIIGLKIIPHLSSKTAFAGIDNVRVTAMSSCRLAKSFKGFMDIVERRMEAELMLQLYHKFYKKRRHCMHNVLARVDLSLQEKPNWESAQPKCRAK